MHEREAPINMLPRSKAPKPQQVEGYKHKRNINTKRGFTSAPEIILLIYVPSQKFPFP